MRPWQASKQQVAKLGYVALTKDEFQQADHQLSYTYKTGSWHNILADD